MFNFDTTWSERVRPLEVTYTRYADDLYFSTGHPNVLQGILDGLREFLRAGALPRLRINDTKTAFSSRKRRRLVAGLVLTSDRRVSIGRHRKRVIKSLVWKLKQRELESDQAASLRGWISYLRSVEPTFVEVLQKKVRIGFCVRCDLGDLRGTHYQEETRETAVRRRVTASQCDSSSAGAASGVSILETAGGSTGGAPNSPGSFPASATFMKSIQMGSAARAPLSLAPRDFFSS